jgi:TRAP-type C4-dicarboxylate transport system permease small subunit
MSVTTKQGAAAVLVIDKVVFAIFVVLAFASVIAMFVSLLLEVIVRYLTNQGLGWTTELPELLFPWLVMSGVVLAAQRGQHIAVTAILGFLNRTAARILLVSLQVLVGATFFYFAYLAHNLLEIVGEELYPVTQISQYWGYLAMVVGCAAVGVTAVTTIWRLILADNPFDIHSHATEEKI